MPKTQTAVRKPNAIVRIIQETVGELRKVTWPTWDEALRLTAVVLVVLVAASLFLGAIDALMTALFAKLLG